MLGKVYGGGIETDPPIKVIKVVDTKYGNFSSEAGVSRTVKINDIPDGYIPIAVVEANSGNAWWLIITELSLKTNESGNYIQYYTINRRTTSGGSGTSPNFKVICIKE